MRSINRADRSGSPFFRGCSSPSAAMDSQSTPSVKGRSCPPVDAIDTDDCSPALEVDFTGKAAIHPSTGRLPRHCTPEPAESGRPTRQETGAVWPWATPWCIRIWGDHVSVRPVHGDLPVRRRRRAGECGRGKKGVVTVAVCLAGRGMCQTRALSRRLDVAVRTGLPGR